MGRGRCPIPWTTTPPSIKNFVLAVPYFVLPLAFCATLRPSPGKFTSKVSYKTAILDRNQAGSKHTIDLIAAQKSLYV